MADKAVIWIAASLKKKKNRKKNYFCGFFHFFQIFLKKNIFQAASSQMLTQQIKNRSKYKQL